MLFQGICRPCFQDCSPQSPPVRNIHRAKLTENGAFHAVLKAKPYADRFLLFRKAKLCCSPEDGHILFLNIYRNSLTCLRRRPLFFRWQGSCNACRNPARPIGSPARLCNRGFPSARANKRPTIYRLKCRENTPRPHRLKFPPPVFFRRSACRRRY